MGLRLHWSFRFPNNMRPITFLFLVLLLAACAPVPRLITSTPATIPPSETVKPPTATLTATLTGTPAFTSTWTPLPTLSTLAAEAEIYELLETNGGCELPCWWGIVPDETDMNLAAHNLWAFASHKRVGSGNGVTVGEFIFLVSESVSPTKYFDVTLTSRGKKVEQIDVRYLESSKYEIPAMLQTFGIPTSIWIKTYKSDYRMPANTVPFVAALFYQDRGILAMYGETDGQVIGSTIHGCIVGSAGLTLWAPDQNLSFDDVATKGVFYDPYMALDIASGIAPEDFYNRFKNGDKKICIDTPANLWPDQ